MSKNIFPPVPKVANPRHNMELVVNLWINSGGDDLHPRKCVGDRVHPRLRHEQGDQVDVGLGHVVVQEHSDRHHGCCTCCHGGVHQDHLVVLDVLGQAEVVELRLTRFPVGLDEDLSDPDVLAHIAQSLLHRLPGSEDGHTTDLLHRAPPTLVVHALRGCDGHRLEGEQGERVLDDQTDQALGVEDELVPRGVLVPDVGVQTLDLGSGREELQSVWQFGCATSVAIVANLRIRS